MIWKPHATVSAVIEDNGRFLLVEERTSNNEIVFNQPAGHLEPGESLIDAVIRETIEETAYRFEPEYVSGIYLWENETNNRTYLRVSFVGQCVEYFEGQPLDQGIIQAHWLTRDEILERKEYLRSPMVLKCIDDYLSGHRYSLSLLKHVV